MKTEQKRSTPSQSSGSVWGPARFEKPIVEVDLTHMFSQNKIERFRFAIKQACCQEMPNIDPNEILQFCEEKYPEEFI